MELTVRRDSITAEAALAAVAAAVRKGQEMGVAVNAAVVDAGGNLAGFLRAPDAFLPSITIAIDKAWTAVGFRMPSGRLYALLSDNPALLDGITGRDRVAAFAGGFPIVVDGRIVGAIGVSGASEEQDCACAGAGLAALGLTHE
ncbi:GlcG/HbpS family heme-binding protein [Azospirillum halopraeferens]|uniref:GlcG/HbpS family heme-binding protein n=1 Tax=Azospirillum halopraeferens TaxID=34010 RepID=UPI0003F8087B|nr:heme-binding protein [Azospirillum halopraeferens]